MSPQPKTKKSKRSRSLSTVSVKKSRKFSLLWIVLGVVLLCAGYFVSTYNSLVNLEENTENSFAKIETQYQRRFDLIPNLTETVKGAADFEKSTFEAVTAARSAWAQGTSMNEKIAAAQNFDSALSRLLVTVEAYPQLKATAAFQDFMVQLEGTENRITFARNEFNDSATAYNKKVRLFPTNLFVKFLGFDLEKNLFESTDGAEVAPQVKFGN